MSKYLTDIELERELENLSDFEVRSECCSDGSEVDGNEGSEGSDSNTTNANEESNTTTADDVLEAKSGRTYLPHPPRYGRRAVHNIFRDRPGLRSEGEVSNILESFRKFFIPEILQLIVQCTNEEADRKHVSKSDETEMLALIGILILIGANDDNNLDYHDLWSKKFGRSAYVGTMSRNRFRDLLNIIRFDRRNTRQARQAKDKFAPLREIFDVLNETFLKYFTPGMNVVIDEMLSLFRGRCPFKVFMKDKPGKYGVLIRILADCETRYVLRMEVYAGKTEGSTSESRGPKGIVRRLLSPIRNSGRNVTTDRYYTSVELAEEVYTNFGLTLVGTMQMNRKHIPEILKKTQGRCLHSNIFAFTDPRSDKPPVTLVSYVTREKPTKILMMLSTQHGDAVVNNDQKNKSDINLFYNETKGGVDTIDQMARKHTTKRSTRRWPVSVFYTLLDFAAINAYSLFLLNFPQWKSTKTNRRRLFLYELGLALLLPNVERRAEDINGLHSHITVAMENLLDQKLSQRVAAILSQTGRGRCHLCYKTAHFKKEKTNKLAKTTISCSKCSRCVCGKHSKKSNVCLNFEATDVSEDSD